MAFCNQCGQELADGARFCFACGASVAPVRVAHKKKVEDSKYQICPGCGATVGSFSAYCPMCGNEMGNVESSNTVQDFMDRLERINARQMPANNSQCPQFKKASENWQQEQKDARYHFEQQKEEEKAELIINFPIPNTKEEIIEFMILATSNIENKRNLHDKVSKVWIAKLDQVYEKAQMSMSNSGDFDQVRRIYEKTHKEVSDRKKNERSALIVFAILLVLYMAFSSFRASRSADLEALQIKNVTMKIADYWEENDSEKNCLRYCVDTDEPDEISLDIKFVVEDDEDYEVSFDGLYADNQNMIKTLEKVYTDANVLTDEIYESKYGVKGILYTFSLEQSTGWFSSEAAKGYCFCFPSESDRRWFYVTLIVVNSQSDDSYLEDYMKTLASIRCK